MTRTHTLTRALVAALAVTALVAPTAGAQPADLRAPDQQAATPQPVNARGTDVAAPDQQAPASKPIVNQDLRSPDAADARSTVPEVRSTLPGPPTWPVDPKPIRPAPVAPVDDDGTPWSTIGISLAVALLALAGSAGTAGRIRRRVRRAGAAA
jgi:hypothetical protein